jgi:predicted MPP superfamily phosphohydrolase
LVAAFRGLSAPLGVWFVLGNHEFHGSGEMKLFEEINFKSLRNRWAEIKGGLIIAGVDDLTYRYRNAEGGDVITQAVAA